MVQQRSPQDSMNIPFGRIIPALILAMILFASSDSDAQTTRMGVHSGINFDGNNVLIGLNGHFGISISDREALLGLTGELYPFLEDMSLTVVELDALFPFRVSALELYGGGGLALRMRRFENLPQDSPLDETDTDVGINGKLGLVYGDEDSGMRPYVEIDQTIGAGTDFAVRLGLYFMLGGG